MTVHDPVATIVDDLPSALLDAIVDVETPCYVFDLTRVERRARAFRAGVERVVADAGFAYPYKVNPMTAIARVAVAVYGGAETATSEELRLALDDGADPRASLLGGIGKTSASLVHAAAAGVTIKVDSLGEVARLCDAWETLRAHDDWRLLLRIALPEAGGRSRFGLLASEATDALASGAPWVRRVVGVHFHAGTSLQQPDPYVDAVRECLPVLDALRASGVIKPVLDVGGGYPNRPDAEVASVGERFAGAMATALDGGGFPVDEVALVCEPGRITVERAGYLVATVVEASARGRAASVVIDAGSTLAGGSWAPVRAARTVLFLDRVEAGDGPCDVFGNLCHEGDLVASEAAVASGPLRDVAVIGDVGGYRLSAAAAWMQAIPPVYELRDGTLELLRGPLTLRALS